MGDFWRHLDVVSGRSLEPFHPAHTQLARTRAFYTLGTNVDAGDVHLSPDGTLLYAVNNESGTVTAAFFNTATGLLTKGCTSSSAEELQLPALVWADRDPRHHRHGQGALCRRVWAVRR